MKRLSLAIVIAAAGLGTMPAVAADLGRLPPSAPFYRPAPLLPVYNWTGCYLGAQLGGAIADNKLNGQFAGVMRTSRDVVLVIRRARCRTKRVSVIAVTV